MKKNKEHKLVICSHGILNIYHNSTLPLQFVVHKKSITDYPEIKNEYLSCFKRAQSLLGNKLDGEGIQKLNQTS